MSKFSKKFRQLKLIKFLINLRSNIFKRFKNYPEYREKVRSLKWNFKFVFLPRYFCPKKQIRKSYNNLRVFRPKSTFTEFDLGIVAEDKNNKTVFIQVITKAHFDRINKENFSGRINSFQMKKDSYETFRKVVAKNDPKRINSLINVLEFNKDNKKFALFISEFRNFLPLFKLVESKKLNDSEKFYLKNEILFYEKIFNECKIFWLDATPHNVMTIENSLEIVPVDFANNKKGDEFELQKVNNISAQKLIKYIDSGFYEY